ncbi:PREDICTED: double-stranded RNA-binding protein 4 [Theobroma cacao]|uniref:Double-stranded RNA-binding protein 4 n=1 Tax=Theobroma cacao TaxID=3641 RepID=A0AB32V9I9_THECC|nr:PREDICTED: double-stranded RNA-binding protein 4 [Theobroma cacao]
MENPILAFLESKLFNQPSAPNPSRAPEPLMHKNRLQEYTQRSSIPLPVYQTTNEGSLHAPRFRSTVLVDGTSYTSLDTFSHRKAAEQDAAKVALDCITKKIKDEGCPIIREDTVFCKSILNEFAVKMNMEMPSYNTIQSEGLIPLFVSSLVFNDVTYSGKTGRNKKEAEQLAARAALLSLLDDSRYGTFLSEIIKSKAKLYVALNKVKDSSISHIGTTPAGANTSIHKNEEIETAVVTNSVPNTVILPSSSGAKRPHHVFKIEKLEEGSEHIDLPIVFVPTAVAQSLPIGESSSRKRRRKKKRAKLDTETQ